MPLYLVVRVVGYGRFCYAVRARSQEHAEEIVTDCGEPDVCSKKYIDTDAVLCLTEEGNDGLLCYAGYRE